MHKQKMSFLAFAALALPACAAADSVSGQFELAGKPTKPAEVAAFRMRDQFHPRTFETYVVLSSKALVNKEAIRSSLDPYAAAINDPTILHADHIAFSVRENGEVSMNANVGGVQYVDTSGKMMGMQGSLTATCKENSATRVACTVKTDGPVKPMSGDAWSLDMSFDAQVLSRASGKPMAKDGEAPGKAFLALRAAVAGNDLAKITALMVAEQAKGYSEDWRSPEENLKSAKEILDVRLPKQPKVTGGEWVAEDHALVEVEGTPYANGKMLYVIDMRRVDGRWLWADSSPVGLLR